MASVVKCSWVVVDFVHIFHGYFTGIGTIFYIYIYIYDTGGRVLTHCMMTSSNGDFSALLTLSVGNSPVTSSTLGLYQNRCSLIVKKNLLIILEWNRNEIHLRTLNAECWLLCYGLNVLNQCRHCIADNKKPKDRGRLDIDPTGKCRIDI